ncbi:MAG TPA: DMT family transporter [Acidimicrobiales bacterium]|jgi:drug/metabolite transporter (DMT)-like permease|nr:DMT family transporter [Acidimicrobiales bacterium]
MGRRYLLLGAVTAGWGTIPVLAGWSHLPSGLIVAFRLWTAAACLGLVLLLERVRSRGRSASHPAVGEPRRLLSYRPVWCCATAAVLGLHWLALFAAYQRGPAGTVILIVYLAPIGVAALAPRLLGEQLGRWTVLTLVGAAAGLALLSAPAVHAAGAAGLLLSLTASVLFVALIVMSKPLAAAYGGLRLAFMELAGAGVLVIPVAVAANWPPFGASWWWVILLGVVHTALGITLYLSVLAEVPATHVGILSYLEPVVVVLSAWLWLGQRPTLATVLGGALVVAAGVVLAATATGSRRRPSPALASVVPVDPAIPSP